MWPTLWVLNHSQSGKCENQPIWSVVFIATRTPPSLTASWLVFSCFSFRFYALTGQSGMLWGFGFACHVSIASVIILFSRYLNVAVPQTSAWLWLLEYQFLQSLECVSGFAYTLDGTLVKDTLLCPLQKKKNSGLHWPAWMKHQLGIVQLSKPRCPLHNMHLLCT